MPTIFPTKNKNNFTKVNKSVKVRQFGDLAKLSPFESLNASKQNGILIIKKKDRKKKREIKKQLFWIFFLLES